MSLLKPCTEWCKKTRLYRWFNREFIASRLIENLGIKLIALFVIWIIGLIPTWVGLGIYFLVRPETIWQAIALVGVIGTLLGGVQIVVGFFLVMATFHIIATDV